MLRGALIFALLSANMLAGCWHLRITDQEEAVCTKRVAEGFFPNVRGCFVEVSQREYGWRCYLESENAQAVKECLWAVKNPKQAKCKTVSNSKEELEKCVWEIENPAEAKCEKLAAKHGGFWECMRLERDVAAHEDDVDVQRAAIRSSEQQAEADREQRRREAVGRALQDAGDSFSRGAQRPRPMKCTSTRTFGGRVETECE